jgi:hypothetical protein
MKALCVAQFVALFAPVNSAHYQPQNDVVKALIDDKRGLLELFELSGNSGGGLVFGADSWSITVGDLRYIPHGTVSTTTTTTQWIAKMGYACDNGDQQLQGPGKEPTFERCRQACEQHTPEKCLEFSWKTDGSCWLWPSVSNPGKNTRYNCGYNVVNPPPAPAKICSLTSSGMLNPASVGLNYTCGDVDVHVAYSLPRGGAFVEKRLSVTAKKDAIYFKGASPYDGIQVSLQGHNAENSQAGAVQWQNRSNPFSRGDPLQIAGFVRWPKAKRGAFLTIANPWGQYDAAPMAKDDSALGLYAFYFGHYNHSIQQQGQWFQSEPGIIGLTSLSSYTNEAVNTGERIAFQNCVENYNLDHKARENKTVKVMVAWDANDYQIDVGTEEGRTQYKRILDRNSEFGITHVVYEPRNTLHSSRFNTTDGWGWEETLWLSLGELIREGKWDPRENPVPQDVQDMVKYASDRNLKLLAYAYPMLPFKKMEKYFVDPTSPNALSLAPPEVQTYLIDVMTAFMQKTGIGGWAWDHDIFAGSTREEKDELAYAQWRGWMNIVGTLRERFPDMVMDHRQTAHRWGPWYQLAGSYAEPIAGDENPESYGVPVKNLHTDHVAADNTRQINYIYSTQGLLPQSRIPGFVFHQSERTDDDGHFYCSKNEPRCVNNSNTRDFDYLGYKYSVLSTVGTAGLNNVFTMIPARDVAEFTLFPKDDVAWIRKWLAWTDAHIDNLRNTQWIPSLSAPGAGHIDGTHAMSGNEGFIFMYNPNMDEMKAKLTVDESLGLEREGWNSLWKVVELYPRDGVTVATWKYGEVVQVSVLGSDARVLALTKDAQPAARVSHATMLGAEITESVSGVDLTEVTGPSGQELIVSTDLGAPRLAHVSANGVRCGTTSSPKVDVVIQMAGEPVYRAMPISPDKPPQSFTGGWFNTTFIIPSAVKQQLHQRDVKYPIPWTHTNASGSCGLPHCVDDSKATWLIPSRLLLYPFLTNVTSTMVVDLFIDGKTIALQRSFNSRGHGASRTTQGTRKSCFLGFYYDASHVEAAKSHDVAIHFPALQQGSFQGLFWENIETEFTSEIASCHLKSALMSSTMYI